MEANEAPKKIYIQPNAHDGWFETNNPTESLVEYTRTDAFIEKACAWFRTLDDKEPPYTNTEEFIEGFKKAMKLCGIQKG